MRRRLAIVLAGVIAMVTLGVAPHGDATPTSAGPVSETNGCVIVYRLKTAICIPRL
jgi:hypothetical protein